MKKLSIIILTVFIFLLSNCAQPFDSKQNITDTYEEDGYEETWGELEDEEGEIVWDTLTEEQQNLVNYPTFNEDSVYWTPGGHSYHSVDWCYTLSNSKTILNGTLDDAFDSGKDDPCSKCVGDY